MNSNNNCSDYVDVDVGEDFIDPRVQIELEQLNSATDAINKLEVELDEARASFRQLLSDSSHKINHLSKKLGNCIDKARPYYEARMKAKEAHTETQKAALKFERANSAHAAAKEMVFLAEEGLQKEGRTFDPAWQEMLNHATMRVNEAERERTFSEVEHRTTSQSYNEAEQRVQQLQKDLKRAISKSSLTIRRQLLQLNSLAYQHQLLLLPYFEMKAQFNQLMEEQKREVHKLEEQILYVKQSYAVALHNLEEISDEIHQRRQQKQDCQALGSRGPGVGAESPIPPPNDRGTSTNDVNMSLNTEDFYLRLPKRLGPLKNSSTCTSEGIAGYVEATSPANINMMESRNAYRIDQGSQTETYRAQSKVSAEGEIPLKECGSTINSADEPVESDRVSAWVHESGLRALAAARRASLLANGQQTHNRLQGHGLPARFMAEESDMSDAESLTSTDVLTDEQIASLMLDKDMEEAYQDIMVVPKRPKELPGADMILNELRHSYNKSEQKSDICLDDNVDERKMHEGRAVNELVESGNVLTTNDIPELKDRSGNESVGEKEEIPSSLLAESDVLNRETVKCTVNACKLVDNLVRESEVVVKEEDLKESKPASDAQGTKNLTKLDKTTAVGNPMQEIKVVAVQFTVTETVVTPKMTRAIDKRSTLPAAPCEKQLNKSVISTNSRE